MDTFLQQVINGLVLGSMYALVALGYTMVYGVLNLINFAHGDVLMIGAMVAVSILGVVQQAAKLARCHVLTQFGQRFEQAVARRIDIVIAALDLAFGGRCRFRFVARRDDAEMRHQPF